MTAAFLTAAVLAGEGIASSVSLPVRAEDEIVSDPDHMEDASGWENPGADGGIATPEETIAADGSSGDLSGLFMDTGEETISREGETLDDARMADEPRSGSGDGGSTVAIGHLYEINGVLVRNSDFPSAHYECWTYANHMYAKIWGHNFWNVFNDTENMLRNLPDEELTLTPEHLRDYVSAAPAGAVLRVCDAQYLHADDGWGHSQIIISHDENGFTVFEGGLAAWPHRREAYYTWTGYCYSGWPGKYHYIKYIKWPGAVPYAAGDTGENALDLGASEEPDGPETEASEETEVSETEASEETEVPETEALTETEVLETEDSGEKEVPETGTPDLGNQVKELIDLVWDLVIGKQ